MIRAWNRDPAIHQRKIARRYYRPDGIECLIITGIRNADEGFSGFSSPAVITVWAVFIVSGGLTPTGVADWIAQLVLWLAGENHTRSTSFLMPIGHQVNGLIYRPGSYRFFDYTPVGVWLNLIPLVLTALCLPIIWPLFP